MMCSRLLDFLPGDPSCPLALGGSASIFYISLSFLILILNGNLLVIARLVAAAG